MSFEIFLQCFHNGQPDGIPLAAVRPLFPVVKEESDPEDWSIRYDDLNRCRIGVSPLAKTPTLIHSLCVLRPCGDQRLWDSLFAVMQLGPVTLYFPGGACPLVASEAVSKHLPADMVKALGWPTVAHSGKDIAEFVQNG